MSRFLDERGRIFGKVNIVDVLVLLVIAAVIVFAVVRLTGESSQTRPVTVTYSVEEVRSATVEQIVGQLDTNGVVTDESGTVLGHMTDVKVTPTEEEHLTSRDQLEKFESPIFSDVQVMVEGKGTLSNGTVRVGSVPMRVGKRVTLVGPGFEVVSVITGVSY